jgi:hypothetical protein
VIKNSVPFFLAALLAGVFAFAAPLPAQGTKPDGKVSRVYLLLPDFLMRSDTPATGDAPTDPFADSARHVKPASGVDARCPKFPWVVPALGPQYPTDARRVFEDLGVAFSEGDAAFFHPGHSRARLFVRAGKDVHDLIDRIINQVFGVHTIKTVRYTWLLTEKDAKGKRRTLLERSLLCRAGQRAKFQRHSAGRLVEEVECETIVWEDGLTVDLNNAVQLHLKALDINVVNQALLRSGDPTGAVLYTGSGSRRGSTAELRVTAEVMRDIPSPGKPPDSHEVLAALAMEIDRQLEELEKTNGREKEKRSDLFYVVPWFDDEVEGKRHWRETGLVQFKAQRMMDAREALQQARVELEKDDAAWYAPESRLLYIRAAATGRARVAEMAECIQLYPLHQIDVQLASTAARKGKVRDLPLRSLLVKGNQQSKAESKTKSGQQETVEIECTIDECGPRTDLNITLTNLHMGRETWTLTTQTLAATDGTLPVRLVSGRAADAGGAFKTLTLTAKPTGDEWQQLVADPVRKAAAIGEFEAALAGPAGGGK